MLAGQAQKEFFVNEAHGLIDALLHASVKGFATAPPPSPSESEAWLAQEGATGDWAGFDHHMCIFFGGGWRFVQPRNGMTVFVESTGQKCHYDGAWKSAAEVAAPTGGANIDNEVRTVVAEMIEALRQVGIFRRN